MSLKSCICFQTISHLLVFEEFGVRRGRFVFHHLQQVAQPQRFPLRACLELRTQPPHRCFQRGGVGCLGAFAPTSFSFRSSPQSCRLRGQHVVDFAP